MASYVGCGVYSGICAGLALAEEEMTNPDNMLTRWLAGMSLPTEGHTGSYTIVALGTKETPFSEATEVYAGLTLKADGNNAGVVEVFLDEDDTVGFPLDTAGSPTMFEIRDIANVRLRGTKNADVVYYVYS